MRSFVAVVIGIFVLGALTLGGSVAAYNTVRQFVIESPIELPAPPQFGQPRATNVPLVASNTTPTPLPVQTVSAGATLAPNVTPTLPGWTDPKRITILLLGIDQRPGEKGPFRTDTMMVLSLDPVRKTASMLSLPRDIYIKIPGVPPQYTPNRINAANFIGDTLQLPEGGPGLAVKTVESLLGIPIQRYAEINFQAFDSIINILGTITVCPTDRIYDTNYPDSNSYGTITVEFKPGCQEVDATRALQYARVRHNAGDDFGRAKRQQEVIKAVRQKALSLGGLAALASKSGEVWAALRDNVRTDLTFDEIMQLAKLAQDVPDIQSAVLEIKNDKGGQLLLGKSAQGDDVLTPIYSEVYTVVSRLFDAGLGGPSNPEASSEAATLLVSNGAGKDGLAKSVGDKLVAQGFNVVGVGNAEGVGLYGKSEIRVYTGKFKTARYLAQVLNLQNTMIQQGTNGPAGVDIQLIVGSDLIGQ